MSLKKEAFFITALVFACVLPCRAEVDVSVTANFPDLDNYGEWIYMPGYGTVWRPDADPEWRPFMYGRWSYTNDGWMWNSDEPFGWIVSHYGNWYYSDDMGWVWVPGYDWSPARVDWYVTDNEIAWAPLFPPPLSGHPRTSLRSHWMFCPVPFFTSADVRSHVEVRARPEHHNVNVRIYSGPPHMEFVQRVGRAPVVVVSPGKVRVSSGNRSLFRVELPAPPLPGMVVPIGRKYRRVEVRTEHAPFEHEARVRESEPQRHYDRDFERSEPRTRVHIESEHNRHNNDREVEVKVRKKVEVEVHRR
jgi:hypothetical protein